MSVHTPLAQITVDWSVDAPWHVTVDDDNTDVLVTV
jgi:hypothetical protein